MHLSAADAPLMGVYDKNVTVYYLFISKGKKKGWKISRFKRGGLSCDAKVKIFSASGKLQRWLDCVRMS